MGRSYQPEAWVRAPKASLGVRALAGVLCSYAEGEYGDQDVWPSPSTVAETLGLSTRQVQRLSEEGEGLGWWTRIHERNRHGGILLTWRLHFPVFTPNGSRTDTEPTLVSVGVDQNEAERKPNGHPTDTQRTPMSDGRVEGFKDRRIKTPTESAPQASLTLVSSEPKRGKTPPAGLLLVTLWNDPDCPQRAKARLEPRNVRRCNAIVEEYGEELLRWQFTQAKRHPYWSGNGNSVPRFSRILSVEGMDAFTKDIDKFAGVAPCAGGSR